MRTFKNTKNGFVALISAIIISAVLMMITFATNFSGFYIRFNVLNSEFKQQSSLLAHACIDTVLFKLTNNPEYEGNEELILVDDSMCNIDALIISGTQKIITIRSIYKDSHTHIRTTLEMRDFSIVSMEETPN